MAVERVVDRVRVDVEDLVDAEEEPTSKGQKEIRGDKTVALEQLGASTMVATATQQTDVF